MSGTLSERELGALHAYWQAANYLTVGQIYLQENPLLREPLRPEHVKPRLLIARHTRAVLESERRRGCRSA